MSTGAGPKNDWYVFNLYPPLSPAASAGPITYLFADDPVVALKTYRRHQRTRRQRDALNGKYLTQAARLGLDLGVAYRAYIVHRLWEPNQAAQQRSTRAEELPPLANLPSALTDLAERQAQLQAAEKRQDVIKQHLQELAAGSTTADDSDADESRQRLYLFNVIVALEWAPTADDRERLQWAFRQMSDLLYDITNGCMAFGQVIFGDRSWMDAADIQIMASNRLLPRSWVSGLLYGRKRMPIRAGRGVWSKRTKTATMWNEYEALSSLVHEWAHYALNQRDTYLGSLAVTSPFGRDNVLIEAEQAGTAASKIVVPQLRAKIDSIMATPSGSSELADLEDIEKKDFFYPDLRIPNGPYAGPNRLPLPLPYFHYELELDSTTQVIAPHKDWLETASRGGQPVTQLRDTPYWVYVLHTEPDGQERVIAQGTLDANVPTNGFRLLGAAPDDTVIVIGNNPQGQLTVWSTQLSAGSTWSAAPVPALPLLSIRPAPVAPFAVPADPADEDTVQADPPLETTRGGVPLVPPPPGAQIMTLLDGVAVRGGIEASSTSQKLADLGLDVDVFSLGTADQLNREVLNTFVTAPSLDGHIVVRRGGQVVMINPYSQGGGPATAPNVTTNPITAGSADGEALLFFDSKDVETGKTTAEIQQLKEAYATVRVVTTTLLSLPDAPADARLVSSAFGVVSNAPLPPELSPTLVILLDEADPRSNLFVCRLENGQWQPLPTYVQPGGAFAATPLAAANVGGSLMQQAVASARVEYFCVVRVG